MLYTVEPSDQTTDDNTYAGVCMEVAGIESCGFGFTAPEIFDGCAKPQNDDT